MSSLRRDCCCAFPDITTLCGCLGVQKISCGLYPEIGVSGQFADCQVPAVGRSEEHTSELQSRPHLVCRLLLEKKKKIYEILDGEKSIVRIGLDVMIRNYL